MDNLVQHLHMAERRRYFDRGLRKPTNNKNNYNAFQNNYKYNNNNDCRNNAFNDRGNNNNAYNNRQPRGRNVNNNQNM